MMNKDVLQNITLQNIKGFLQGNFRKTLETLGLESLIPDHIQEQVQWRLGVMNIECLEKGKCPCNCQTPNKQFEDRQCDLGCYPDMMSETDWRDYKTQHNITKQTIEENLYKRKDLIWK